MPVYQRPGVYVEETLNPLPPVVGANSTSVAAFAGASDRGPSAATLVTSWSQYVKKFGGWNTVNGNDLPTAVYLYFANGGANAYVSRVTAGTPGSASADILDSGSATALTFTALNDGTWGNHIAIGISAVVGGAYDVAVYYGGVQAANIVERFADVSTDPTAARFIETVVNGYSEYLTVAVVSGDDPVNTGSSPVVLSTGSDGSSVGQDDIVGAITVDGAFDLVTNSLVLNAAGVTDAGSIGNLIAWAEGRGDVFVVIDALNDTVLNQLARAAQYTASSYAAVYYPQITITDPQTTVSGATKSVSPAGAVVGLMALTDASRGVFKAPAGLQSRLAAAVSVKQLTNAELDLLNSSNPPVNAIKYVVGSGIVVMGSRTLKAGYVDRYVPTRRTLIYLRKALTDLTEFAVFENNDQALWNRLDDSVSNFLTSFWSQGGLKGATPGQAFFVKCDADTNPQNVIDAGEVRIEVGVALQRPAEFVIIKIGQFEGGATVTVA